MIKMTYKVLFNNISIMDICDCCYEQSYTSTRCSYGHKLCIDCKNKLNYDTCIFCNPLENKKKINYNNTIYSTNFLFTYRVIVIFYCFILIFFSFFIDGFIWMFLDFVYHFIFDNHEIVLQGISYYFPTLIDCIFGFLTKVFIFLSYLTYIDLDSLNQGYYAYNYRED